MQEAKIKSNPLIRSVVHTSFRKAVSDLGFASIPKDLFQYEIAPYLRAAGSLFDDSQETLDKLFHAVMRGEVIVTETEDDTIVFYVRGSVTQRVIDVRLSCRHQQWHVKSVVSMYHRPLLRWNWFYRAAFAVSVVLAGVIGYALHEPHAVVSATSQGSSGQAASVSTSLGQAKTTDGASSNTTNSSVPSAGNATSNSTGASNSTSNTSGATSKTHAPSSFTFTLKSGMSIHDLSMFLHANHLINEPAVQFDMVLMHAGVDKTIRPGSYTFKSGMTQSQLLQVIEKGPSK
ncbi:hypothetical protein NZD89_01005 [Alicyclobacillus fastidiosus]|uniref:Uncharacterized protein n=1 Tax=Alicyclobacillus fastidiosus TaxID=392011 RepID=A0ABY6ZHD6_9BACL|nr:hypothetical protein [Alicyclobacillus fastidiosus]WAH42130.1 hypothetical protein NZD89_01005 [Alicyclobacillus fastidiosus]